MNKTQRLRVEFLTRVAYNDNEKNVHCVYCYCDDITALVAGHRSDDAVEHAESIWERIRWNISSRVQKGSGSRKGGCFGNALPKALSMLGWPKEDLNRLQVECQNCNSGRKRSQLRHVSRAEINDYMAEVRNGLAQGQEAGTV